MMENSERFARILHRSMCSTADCHMVTNTVRPDERIGIFIFTIQTCSMIVLWQTAKN